MKISPYAVHVYTCSVHEVYVKDPYPVFLKKLFWKHFATGSICSIYFEKDIKQVTSVLFSYQLTTINKSQPVRSNGIAYKFCTVKS